MTTRKQIGVVLGICLMSILSGCDKTWSSEKVEKLTGAFGFDDCVYTRLVKGNTKLDVIRCPNSVTSTKMVTEGFPDEPPVVLETEELE